MFNAEDAQRLVHQYYEKNEFKCIEWVKENLDKALAKAHHAAELGHTETVYALCLEKEKYQVIKRKLLFYALLKQKFKVSVQESYRREGPVKIFTNYTISWSTNGKPEESKEKQS